MRCRRPITLASLVALAAFSLLAAGCGGGGSPGVASVASSTASATTTAQTGLAAYSRCMRSNGVATFPDPNSSGEVPKLQVVAARESNPRRFDSASNSCSHLLPDGSLGQQQTAQQKRTQLTDELSFARCMRSHGVTRFPDPTAQGDLSVARVEAQGIDVHSPAVLRVVQACLPASHGALTMAKVNEALNNAGG
jgi:phage tail protein X